MAVYNLLMSGARCGVNVTKKQLDLACKVTRRRVNLSADNGDTFTTISDKTLSDGRSRDIVTEIVFDITPRMKSPEDRARKMSQIEKIVEIEDLTGRKLVDWEKLTAEVLDAMDRR
jgi:hypothetical protein